MNALLRYIEAMRTNGTTNGRIEDQPAEYEPAISSSFQRSIQRYILVMQRFRVVYYGISHESLVFSRMPRKYK